jgi:hypothetical protein
VRVEWLDTKDFNEARLTRGRLWWKRVAHVRRLTREERDAQGKADNDWNWWRYVPSGRRAWDVEDEMEAFRQRDIIDTTVRGDWVKPSRLPPARLVEGGR